MQAAHLKYNLSILVNQNRRFLLIALLYFFFNSLFLPQGLLYTDLLVPLFIWWLYKHSQLRLLLYFFILTIPFILIHFYNNVNIWYYFRSYAMFFTVVITAVCFYVSLKEGYALDHIFKKILIINFGLFCIALLALPSPELKKVFWYFKEFSPGTGSFPRLKLFTYEASYYSLLFAPIAIYFYLRLMLFKVKKAGILFLMVTLPLLFSMSYGVIACIAIVISCLIVLKARLFLRKKSTVRFFIISILVVLTAALVLFKIDPNNPIFFRIHNIFTGHDTSFRGRTYESFILAFKILKEKSILFGVGLGQVKIIGVSVFKQYYGYLPPVVRIPNTLSDTMATYGIVGLAIRMFFTLFFFFKLKIWRNYYQLAMFIFIFIYQFTGSFMTNVVEYVIWVLVFTPAFEEFDRQALTSPVIKYVRPLKKVNIFTQLIL